MKALQLDFLLSVLNRVGAMADVAADSEAEVATNSTCKVQGAFSYQNKGQPENRNEPGAEARGFVAPSIARPVLTASRPCQTMATTGPEAMYLMRPGKNGLSLKSS